MLGADYNDHNILHHGIGMEQAVGILKHIDKDVDKGLEPTGKNLGKSFDNWKNLLIRICFIHILSDF